MMASMLSMPTQIELYEEMSVLSARMVDAAQANDWDHLVDLERGVSALRDSLKLTEEPELSPLEAGRKRRLIQRILEDDAEVRRYTEPWMEQVRTFLGQNTKRQRMEQAYGALVDINTLGGSVG